MAQSDKANRALAFTGAFDVVAIAASAGGLAALRTVLAGPPENFPAAVVIVQHLDPAHPSMLASILARHTTLRVQEATASDVLAPATVLTAPPNHHLLVNRDGSLSLTQSELVHFVRPSADLLFESVAASFGARALAIILTGSGTDGAMGVRAIKKMGGAVIAQDNAEFSSMPLAAQRTGDVDLVLPLDQIAPQVMRLVMPSN